jgi:hypothetical protein
MDSDKQKQKNVNDMGEKILRKICGPTKENGQWMIN